MTKETIIDCLCSKIMESETSTLKCEICGRTTKQYNLHLLKEKLDKELRKIREYEEKTN